MRRLTLERGGAPSLAKLGGGGGAHFSGGPQSRKPPRKYITTISLHLHPGVHYIRISTYKMYGRSRLRYTEGGNKKSSLRNIVVRTEGKLTFKKNLKNLK